jgi:hypothetical protein
VLHLAAVVRRNLYAFVMQEGMKALDVMLEQDRQALCGPPHGKAQADEPVRWGHTEGRLVMGGQRVVVKKPRVRHQGKEVTLPSWAEFADEDPLDARAFESSSATIYQAMAVANSEAVIREAFASSSESAEHARTDFAPLGGRFPLVTSGFHATTELREPRRLPVAIRGPVYARDELRG